ncbi:MAG: sigma-70 family RNA polymerase sigma factor [Acidobacteriota bacterium]
MISEMGKLNQLKRSVIGWLYAGRRQVQLEVVDGKATNRYALRESHIISANPQSRSMVKSSPQEVTRLLQEWRRGDRAALEKLTPLVYDELRRLANHYLRGERKDHTLQGTALVHEAYMKMCGYTDINWSNRSHFFGVAAHIMRQILIDHARKHQTDKRGGGKPRIPLEEAAVFSIERATELIALDDALIGLEHVDALKSRLIELRYFAGLQIEEIADVESISVATVRRHLRMAEAWLHRELNHRM